MNGRSTMEYLQHGAAGILTYGLIRGREDIIAFGTITQDKLKIRLGSIALQEESADYKFLVLSMDSAKEFRAKDRNQLHWFLWAFGTSGNWDNAEDWSNGQDVPIIKQYH